MSETGPSKRARAVRLGWLQSAILVYGFLGIANAFFAWSLPAWFVLCFWEDCGAMPAGLVNPAIDKWIIEPLAMAILYIQLPSWLLVFNVKPFSLLEPPWSTLVISATSLLYYLPLTKWLAGRWEKHLSSRVHR